MFQPTCFVLVDFGAPGVAWAEASPGATPDDIYAEIKSGCLDGAITVLNVAPGAVSQDITADIALRICRDLESGEQLCDGAIEFAERFAGYTRPKTRSECRHDEAEARAKSERDLRAA